MTPEAARRLAAGVAVLGAAGTALAAAADSAGGGLVVALVAAASIGAVVAAGPMGRGTDGSNRDEKERRG